MHGSLALMRVMTPRSFLLFGVAAAIEGETTGSAQASFELRNVSVGVYAPVYDGNGQRLFGSQWRAEVYGGASADSLSPVVDFYDRTRAIMAFGTAGFFREPPGGSDVYSVLDAPCGGWAYLQVKVWDVQLGATYEEASARNLGGYGESNVFYAQGGYPCMVTPTPSGPLLGLQSFSVLQEIPEPSEAVLLAVGGLGLWAWRRGGRRRRGDRHSCAPA